MDNTERSRKILVVFFSYEDSTRTIAESIAEAVDAELLELLPRDSDNGAKIMNYVWENQSVTMDSEPELEDFDVDPDEYDLIFLGTPIWAMTFAPPFKTFFSRVQLEGKNIAFFYTHEGLRGVAVENLRKELIGNNIVGHADFYDPLNSDLEKIVLSAASWAREVLYLMRAVV